MQTKTEQVAKRKDKNKPLTQTLEMMKNLPPKESNKMNHIDMNQAMVMEVSVLINIPFLTYMYNNILSFCQYLATESTSTSFRDVLIIVHCIPKSSSMKQGRFASVLGEPCNCLRCHPPHKTRMSRNTRLAANSGHYWKKIVVKFWLYYLRPYFRCGSR